MLFPSDLFLLIVGPVIAMLGSCAIVVHAFRRKPRERVLLWFGLFCRTLRHNSYSWELGVARFVVKLVAFWTIIRALLLFKEFYGKGWRSSIH
jgi:hypothetical protein